MINTTVELEVSNACLVLSDSADQPVIDHGVQSVRTIGPWTQGDHVVGLAVLVEYGPTHVEVTFGAGIPPAPEGWTELGQETVTIGPEVYLGTIDLTGGNLPKHVGTLGERGLVEVVEYGRLVNPEDAYDGTEYLVHIRQQG